MSYRVRPARAEDLDAVEGFTQGTFDWGDYVAESFMAWLEDPRGRVLVAVDGTDAPVGLARVVLMSDTEAWMHAARVHPDRRRGGVGSLLNRAGCDFARERGALIARLLIESWNEPARNQVEKLGYHETGHWVSATKALAMEPTTNGGRRVSGEERLTPARRTEVDLAWMTWDVGDLALTGRQLFPVGWTFRRMTRRDLDDAVGAARLYHSPSGWVVGAIDAEGTFNIPWVQTTDLDADRLVKAVIDLADGQRAESVWALLPAADWLTESLTKYGFSLRPSSIWSLSL